MVETRLSTDFKQPKSLYIKIASGLVFNLLKPERVWFKISGRSCRGIITTMSGFTTTNQTTNATKTVQDDKFNFNLYKSFAPYPHFQKSFLLRPFHPCKRPFVPAFEAWFHLFGRPLVTASPFPTTFPWVLL